MNCQHTFTRPDGSDRRCSDPATETGRCSFHSINWTAHHELRDAEAAEYAEETGGRNLFLDRFAGVERAS